MSNFRLIHRTNHQGLYINPTNNDEEVSLDVIWMQAVWRGQGCCRHFGDRVVVMEQSDFLTGGGDWFLYDVSLTRPYSNSHHVFCKFVLSRRNHDNQWGEPLARFPNEHALSGLRQQLGALLAQQQPSEHFFHFHVGIETDGSISRVDTVEAKEEHYEEEVRIGKAIKDAIEQAYWKECVEEHSRIDQAIYRSILSR